MKNMEIITGALNDENLISGIKSAGQLFNKFLRNPGNYIHARVTDSGRQVIKAANDEIKCSAVRYPSTGTIVETRVYKAPKE